MNAANLFNRTDDALDVISTEILSKKNTLLFSSAQPASTHTPYNTMKGCSLPSPEATRSSTSSSDSSSALLNGREPLLMVFAFLAVSVAVFSYAQSNASSNLLSYITPTDGNQGGTLLETTRGILSDPGSALDVVVDKVHSMGPLGVVYFGVAYTLCEILAVPAFPLTASAGYLFGPAVGTTVVLLSASVAAGISFAIGRTLLRDFVEGVLQDHPKFAKLDCAIGKEGFKLMLLLRLSPIFPFALSNYLYGASSIDFPAFFGGTLLGFAPGTLAYVYAGYIGKTLTTDGAGDVYPWYVYVGGMTLFAGLLKLLADTATRIVEEIESDDDEL
jgi:uncharacterized membrane protein YdjX (TVP38/TMEM64 family)